MCHPTHLHQVLTLPPGDAAPIQGPEGHGHRLTSHQTPSSKIHPFPGMWLLSKKPSQKGTVCQRDSDKPGRGVRRQSVRSPTGGRMLVKCAGNAGTWTTYQVLDHTALQGSDGGGFHSPERGDSNCMHTPASMSSVQ